MNIRLTVAICALSLLSATFATGQSQNCKTIGYSVNYVEPRNASLTRSARPTYQTQLVFETEFSEDQIAQIKRLLRKKIFPTKRQPTFDPRCGMNLNCQIGAIQADNIRAMITHSTAVKDVEVTKNTVVIYSLGFGFEQQAELIRQVINPDGKLGLTRMTKVADLSLVENSPETKPAPTTDGSRTRIINGKPVVML